MTVDTLYNRAGPNRLIEANQYYTTDVTQAVKLQLANEGFAGEEPISVPAVLKQSATNYADYPALKYKDASNNYHTVTYK